MKWSDTSQYIDDSTRRRRKFLWIPTRVGIETRWLTWAFVEEVAIRGGKGGTIMYWRVRKFC